jgi:hypothetical protein
MHEIAIEDYIGARHSVLQLGLFTVGFALAAQAIEKLLKCYLMLDGAQLADMKKHSHNLDALVNAAASNSPALQAKKAGFANLCAKLQAWYQSRYPVGPGSASEWMRADIAPIDGMVVYLEEHMPLPEAVAPLVFAGGNSGRSGTPFSFDCLASRQGNIATHSWTRTRHCLDASKSSMRSLSRRVNAASMRCFD